MIVDTGPLVATLNSAEANHEFAVAVLAEAQQAAKIPLPVLIEVDHLTRSAKPRVQQFRRDVKYWPAAHLSSREGL